MEKYKGIAIIPKNKKAMKEFVGKTKAYIDGFKDGLKTRPEHGYWLIPPEIYNPLNKEFNFDFDPCPNPKPENYDGLKVEWGKFNWVNPPFWAGITGWVRKAIEEQKKGKTSVLILPLDNWVRLLIENGAEIRSLGSHDWVHTKDRSRRKAPRPSFLFILKPQKGGLNSSQP